MTINVALVTSEAVILGCDSVASLTERFLNPIAHVPVDPNGNFETDENGRLIAHFTVTDLQTVVTDAWGGVTKMFKLCDGDYPVAAVTAGLAKLNDRLISSLVHDFSKVNHNCKSVREVVEKFVQIMGAHYDQHYSDNNVPPQLRDDVEFLVGGFGANDAFPSLYRVNLIAPPEQRLKPLYGEGPEFPDKSGAAWAGQADSVQRLLFGWDNPVRLSIERQFEGLIDKLYTSMSESTLKILSDTLAALNQNQIPETVNTELPERPQVNIDWNQFTLNIDFANLPLQSALDFVSYLVGLQSGKAKYVRGVPTVGGRTHIGILTKGKFEMKNEPELTHTNVGYDRGL